MFAVLIPVGPDARDVSRFDVLTGELEQHEDPLEMKLIVIDDAAEPRDLGITWPHSTVIRTGLWGRLRPDPLSAHVAGTLEGLGHAVGQEFAIKLDTDAAVIGSFSGPIRRAFQDPGIGVVGSYDVTSAGGRRDWSVWKRDIDRATRPLALARSGWRIHVWRRPAWRRAAVRGIRTAAYRLAPAGAHCLGGAYAVSAAFLTSVSLDWRPWVQTRLGEDVVVGLLASAAGLRMESRTGPAEPFALAWRGLPGPPRELVSRGHSILHSVKRAHESEEQALRDELQRLAAALRA